MICLATTTISFAQDLFLGRRGGIGASSLSPGGRGGHCRTTEPPPNTHTPAVLPGAWGTAQLGSCFRILLVCNQNVLSPKHHLLVVPNKDKLAESLLRSSTLQSASGALMLGKNIVFGRGRGYHWNWKMTPCYACNSTHKAAMWLCTSACVCVRASAPPLLDCYPAILTWKQCSSPLWLISWHKQHCHKAFLCSWQIYVKTFAFPCWRKGQNDTSKRLYNLCVTQLFAVQSQIFFHQSIFGVKNRDFKVLGSLQGERQMCAKRDQLNGNQKHRHLWLKTFSRRFTQIIFDSQVWG